MYYYSFGEYLKDKYGRKVRKIGLNAGFTCPNRDGLRGEGGCIFCNDSGFSEFPDNNISLKEQIDSTISTFKKKGVESFIAYFQNGSNTYAPVEELKKIYDIIHEYPEIVGLFISTRPDCVNDEVLDLIQSYTSTREVWVEYGLQTVHDKTLEYIGRGHSFTQTEEIIRKTSQRGIKVGVHVILGLPGESTEDMMETAEKVSRLPVSGVKLHLLHVLKNTPLERLYNKGEVKLLEEDEYINIACDFIERLSPDCVLLRLASDARVKVLVAPKWMNKKLEVIRKIDKEFLRRKTRQGSAFSLLQET